MDRPVPTDPPEEPVNRIAWAMEPGAHEPPAEIPPVEPVEACETADSLQQDLEVLLQQYASFPEVDHLPELLVFVKHHMNDPESALMFLDMISKSMAAPLAASGNVAVFQLMIQDLQRHLEDDLSS